MLPLLLFLACTCLKVPAMVGGSPPGAENATENATMSTTTTVTTTTAMRGMNAFFNRTSESEPTTGTDDLLTIILSVSGGVVGLLLCFGAACCLSLHRRAVVSRQYSDIVKLESQEHDFEADLDQLEKNIELYHSRLGALPEEKKSSAHQGTHRLLREKWEGLLKDSRHFIVNEYTPEFNKRNPDVEVGSHTVTGVSIGSDLGERRQVKGLWPKPACTSSTELRRQLTVLNDLSVRLRGVDAEFQAAVSDVFPGGLEECEELPGQGPETTETIRDAKVEEEVALIRSFAHPLLLCAVVKSYGVLGVAEGAPKLRPRTRVEAVVVDPAGWPHIGQRNNPRGASGVSASIYDWLGVSSGNASFPPEVHEHFNTAFEAEAQKRAKFYSYDTGLHVVHVLNPAVTEVLQGLYDLSHTYLNLLTEFCCALEQSGSSMPRTLRLMPLAKNVPNKLLHRMAEMTWSALCMAFAMMPPLLHVQLRGATIEVCVSKKRDLESYEDALARRKDLVHSKPRLSQDVGRVEKRNGNYDWVRQKNAPTDRLRRLNAMLMTQQATCSGGYMLPDGKLVELHLQHMLKETRLSSAPATSSRGPKAPQLGSQTKIVHAGTTITVMEAAIKAHNSGKRTVAVNAASAYSVGGGVLTGGRHALEETWCTMSTLLGSLQKVQWEQLQVRTKHNGGRPPREAFPQHIPADACIVSPAVEIFRDTSTKGYPFQVSCAKLLGVCSVAMFNMNPRVRDSPQDAPKDWNTYCRQVKQKFHAVFAASSELGAEVLVCPDVGCGVFENDPQIVGALFGEALRESSTKLSEVVITGKDKFYTAAASVAKGGEIDMKRPLYFDPPSSDESAAGPALVSAPNAEVAQPPGVVSTPAVPEASAPSQAAGDARTGQPPAKQAPPQRASFWCWGGAGVSDPVKAAHAPGGGGASTSTTATLPLVD